LSGKTAGPTRCGDGKACRVKSLATSCGGVFSERPRRNKNKAASGKKFRNLTMYSGTLIQDLIAVVQRAEQAAQLSQEQASILLVDEGVLAATEQTAAYSSKLLGVA
jgi:hypothetical protein